MNKRALLKKIGLVIVVVGVLVGAAVFVLDYLSWKNVTLKLSSDTQSVIIYYGNKDKEHDSNLVEAARVSSSGTIRLKTGLYSAVPAGEKVSSTVIDFTVTGDSSVDISPYYSEEYLAATFGSEINSLHSVIAAKYPFVNNNYTIEDGRFYHYGDWYVTTLFNTAPKAGDGVDIYGVLLHRVDGVWSVVNSPTLVFTYANYSSVPKDIVNSANHFLYGL